MMLSGKAKIAGVIGWPVAHSLSPRLHGYWLRHYNIDGAYIPMAVRPNDLQQALRALPALGFQGCNITLPHKEQAMKAMDQVTERAKRAGAVNTVIVTQDGLIGDNSDGIGFANHLRAVAPDWRPGPVLLLGAGGAARAIAACLLDELKVPEIFLANRTEWRGEKLAADLGGPIRPIAWQQRHDILKNVSLLINSTFLGQAGQAPLHLDLTLLPREAVIYDIVYAPLKTALLAEGEKRGNRVIDGLGMLLHQARPGFTAWFGQEPEVTEALRTHILDGLTR